MNVRDVLKNTDWKLLREQKMILLNTTYVLEAQGDKRAVDALEGLVNLLDCLQDAVVDEGIATDEEVFGEDS